MSSKAPPKERKNYYILLQDITVNPQHEKIHIAGTLWELENLFSNKVILVRKYEGEDIGELQEIPVELLLQIKYDEAHILLAVPDPLLQRLQIINDKAWLEEGLKIIVGSVIEVHNVPELPDGALATVRYKGRLPGRNGTYFGVELHPEHAGKGSTNGTYRRKKLFSCDEDSGLFLSLLRIRFYYARSHNSGARPKTRPATEGASGSNVKDETDNLPKNLLEINERVVWISDSGPEFGTVRWQGILPYSYDNKFIVGVEFDNPVGTGTGKYKGQQLFSAKRSHASLLPILGLMKLSEYEKMFNTTVEVAKDKVPKENDSRSRDHGSELQRNTSFALGGNTERPREPQEHKDIIDSQYETGRSSELIPSSTNKQEVPDKTNTATTRDRPKASTKHTDSGVSVPGKSGPGSKRISAFAAGKVPRSNEETYVPHVLLEPEGKIISKSGSFRDMSLQSSSTRSLQVGDRVSVTLGTVQYGTIRWIGHIPESSNPQRVFAGLEMDSENKIFTGGTWQGRRIFECPDKRGFFFDLEKCTKLGLN